MRLGCRPREMRPRRPAVLLTIACVKGFLTALYDKKTLLGFGGKSLKHKRNDFS